MSEVEWVLVQDDKGTYIRVSLVVLRRIKLSVDCGCWSHRAPFEFELVVTHGGVYVRNGEGVFRSGDSAGAVYCTVSQMKQRE